MVATSKKNASVSLVFSFLYKIVQVCLFLAAVKSYVENKLNILYVQQVNNMDIFQVFSEYFKELEEESIRDNFVIIYELLDELMDFGYPQTTDSKILQE